jgi:hypothetical protein
VTEQGPVMGCCHLEGHLYILGLVDDTPATGIRCIETALQMLCYCEAHAGFMYCHFGTHLLKPSDYQKAPISKLLHLIQDAMKTYWGWRYCTMHS